MALCIEEYLQNSLDFYMTKNSGWNQLEDSALYTILDAFIFFDNAYYFRMFKNFINILIPSGVINYLIEEHYVKKFKIQNFENDPQVLSLDDLLFGFKIWLGCCLLSLMAFIAEQFKRFWKRQQGVETHPSITEIDCNSLEEELTEDEEIDGQNNQNEVEIDACYNECNALESNSECSALESDNECSALESDSHSSESNNSENFETENQSQNIDESSISEAENIKSDVQNNDLEIFDLESHPE